MTNEQIEKLLESPTYDFLRTDSHLKDRIMLLTLGGSHAYGTNIETSDVDIRGIVAEGKEELLGLSVFEQFDNKATDTVLYALRKIVHLLINCNPNVIEIMGTSPDQIFILTKEGNMLRENAGLFLSGRAKNSFGGYANAQLRRLQNALARDNYPQTEKEKHILGSVKSMLESLRERYQEFGVDDIKLYIDDSDKEDFETEIFMDVNMKHYPLRDFKNIYSDMSNVIKDYSSLNHRNNKKDEFHLNKHIMHLVRLFIMGSEILEGEGIHTNRRKDRPLLMDLRNGVYVTEDANGIKNYDAVYEIVDKYEKRFQYAIENSTLPDNPDYGKIEDLVMEINSRLLKKYGL
jgi:predicted nucleotidyltransferase